MFLKLLATFGSLVQSQWSIIKQRKYFYVQTISAAFYVIRAYFR